MKKIKIINKAVKLRKKGFSFREISNKLNIAKSTTSLWLKDVKLSNNAKRRIINLGIIGRKKGIEANKKKRKIEDDLIKEKVKGYFSNFKYSRIDFKVICALLYWCEGTKNDGAVVFMNSDPEMIKYFLYSFRNSFSIDESKFRALIHLHKYHNPETQLKFWSNITEIPKSRFFKPYFKSNTGKNKKENYPGCISIRYYDKKVFKELVSTYKKLYKMRG